MPDKGFQESLYSFFIFAFNNQFPLTNVPVYLRFSVFNFIMSLKRNPE